METTISIPSRGDSSASLSEKLSNVLKARYAIWLFLLFVLITHIPTGKSDLAVDDFVQWAAVTQPDVLADKGFHIADSNNSFKDTIFNSFLFMSADNSATQELKEYGALPWWTPDGATMHMFRPLSALTHWLDYKYLDNVFLMQLHSVFYLLLLAASLYCFYRVIGCPSWVPLLAVGLFVFSYSMPFNLNWLAARNAILAPMFGIWAMIFHHLWRDRDQSPYAFLSLAALLLALLSAEAGIATLGYLGAYALVLDKRRSLVNLWTIVPALSVVVIWRLVYSSYGFGTEDIDLYVDPVRSPLQFVTDRVILYPVYQARLLLGPLFGAILNITSNELLVALICGLLLLIPLYLTFNLLKTNRLMQFAFLGNLAAIVPFLATNPSPRSDPFLHIGLFICMSLWVYSVFQNGQFKGRLKVLVVFVLAYYLAIPTIATAARHWRLVTVEAQSVDAYGSIASDLKDSDATLVVVNSPDYFRYYYRPFSWAYKGYSLPAKVHLLAPGLVSMDIYRKSDTAYVLTSSEGFPLYSDAQLEGGQASPINKAKVRRYNANNQIVTNEFERFAAGDLIEANGFSIHILEMQNNLPTKLRVEFNESQAQVWQWFDWQDASYKKMSELEVGESRRLEGPYRNS